MIESSWTKTEDRVVEILSRHHRLEAKDLHAYITQQQNISLQGLYDILAKLVDAGVLIKKSRLYILSHEWVYRVKTMLESHAPALPQPGESFRFSFKSLTHSETFWKSIFYAILDRAPREPVFISVPHPIWGSIPERDESDMHFQKLFQIHQRHVYYTVMNESVLGRHIMDTMRSPVMHIQSSKMPRIKHQHTDVVGDFILVTKLSKKTEEKLDRFFSKKDATKKELEELLSEVSKVTVTVENNPDLAHNLRSYMGKDFILEAS